MNEKAIALIVFFTSLFILGQIRFFLKLRKIRKSSENLPGVQYVYEMLECCCLCGGLVKQAADTYDEEEEKKAFKKRTEKMLKEREERKSYIFQKKRS